ncbi:MAG: DUF523 domain-containing protein [Clostridiaceae bacterium]|nr:DUF523 domain-containing protein [Clostridiaceae bacterium]
MILVSACLMGVDCKYNGKNNKSLEILELMKHKQVIPVCPEQLGGLTTPRLAAEIQGGEGKDVLSKKAKVLRKDGADISEAFIKGAEETLKIAESMGAKSAVLKARSPSCGTGEIYDGTFKGKIAKGDGVTTALLKMKGIQVLTEESDIIIALTNR